VVQEGVEASGGAVGVSVAADRAGVGAVGDGGEGLGKGVAPLADRGAVPRQLEPESIVGGDVFPMGVRGAVDGALEAGPFAGATRGEGLTLVGPGEGEVFTVRAGQVASWEEGVRLGAAGGRPVEVIHERRGSRVWRVEAPAAAVRFEAGQFEEQPAVLMELTEARAYDPGPDPVFTEHPVLSLPRMRWPGDLIDLEEMVRVFVGIVFGPESLEEKVEQRARFRLARHLVAIRNPGFRRRVHAYQGLCAR